MLTETLHCQRREPLQPPQGGNKDGPRQPLGPTDSGEGKGKVANKQKYYYYKNKKAGLCTKCGQRKPIKDRSLCAGCRDKMRAYGMERYEKRVTANDCTKCGVPLLGSVLTCCEKCFEGRRVRKTKTRAAQRKPYTKRSKFVYFLLAPKSGMVKIGRTANATGRIEGLQIGCPEKLKLLLLLEEHPPFEERRLHRRFNKYRSHGEWFRYTGKVVKFVREQRRTHETHRRPRWQ